MRYMHGDGSNPPLNRNNEYPKSPFTHPAAGDRGTSQLVRASDGFTRAAVHTPKDGVSAYGGHTEKPDGNLKGVKSASKVPKPTELSRTDQKKSQLNDYLAEYIRHTNNIPRAISIGNKALVCIEDLPLMHYL